MLERLGLVLLAFVLVFAFAPYFYALADVYACHPVAAYQAGTLQPAAYC